MRSLRWALIIQHLVCEEKDFKIESGYNGESIKRSQYRKNKSLTVKTPSDSRSLSCTCASNNAERFVFKKNQKKPESEALC